MDPPRHRLSLKIYPDSVLRQMCEPVDRFDSELRDLVDEMLVLMRANNGIGLAAPQVGIVKRLFVYELEGHVVCVINPRMRRAKGESEMVEGCLSLPGVLVNVTRSNQILVRCYDLSGQRTRFKMSGLWARVALHEMDHLNGVLICDYGEDLGFQSQLHALCSCGDRRDLIA
jgi:peptide deformylase